LCCSHCIAAKTQYHPFLLEEKDIKCNIRCSAEGYAKAMGILNEEKEEYVEFKEKRCDSFFFFFFFIFLGRVEETLSILKLLNSGYL